MVTGEKVGGPWPPGPPFPTPMIYTTARLYMLSLPCLSGLIRRFALHNLCNLNSNSWAALVAQLVERLL